MLAGVTILAAAILMLNCASDHLANTSQLPSTPTDLSGGAISSSQIYLTWQDNSENENGFDLFRRLAGEGVSWTRIARLPENTNTYTDHDLVDSTAYDYYVSAFNSAGSSAASAIATISTRAIGLAPEQPYNIYPWNGDTLRSDTLIWTCSDPDGDPLQYDLYVGTGNPPGIMDAGLTDTTFVLGGLHADTTYYWQVAASDTHKHRVLSPVWYFHTLAK